MNNLNPEERRAKADEIARLLETEPLLAQELSHLLTPATKVLLRPGNHYISQVVACAAGDSIRE